MTDSTIKKVIVVGAAGTIGAFITNELLKSNSFNVSVLTREESKATFPAEFTVHRTNYSDESLVRAFKGQDAVVSAVNATPDALQLQFKMVDACLAAGVKRFIPSEFGIDTYNEKAMRMVRVLDLKVKLLRYLSGKERDGFSWTAINTGSFMDDGLKTGFLGFYPDKKTALIYGGGEFPVAYCNMDFVGRSVVATLERPEETANTTLYVAQAYATQNELLKRLEQDAGVKYSVAHTTIEEQQSIGENALMRGDFMAALIPLITSTAYGGGGSGFLQNGRTLANEMLGLEKPSLDNCFPEAYKMGAEVK